MKSFQLLLVVALVVVVPILGLNAAWAASSTTAPPSLAALRAELALFESSIVQAYLARHSLSPGFFKGEKELTRKALDRLTSLVDKKYDRAANEDEGAFYGGPLKYVFYQRDKARFGDSSQSQTGSIFDGLFASSPHQPATEEQQRMVEPAAVLDGALLSVISSRIGIGKEVARAKAASDRGKFCDKEATNSSSKVRQNLTDQKQVDTVKKSVQDKFTKWSASTPSTDEVQRFVSFFERIIDVTTDVEVYTIKSNQAGC